MPARPVGFLFAILLAGACGQRDTPVLAEPPPPPRVDCPPPVLGLWAPGKDAAGVLSVVDVTLNGHTLHDTGGSNRTVMTLHVDPAHPAGTIQEGDAAPFTLGDPQLELLESTADSSGVEARYRLRYTTDLCEHSTPDQEYKGWQPCAHGPGDRRPVLKIAAEALVLRERNASSDVISVAGTTNTSDLLRVFRVAGGVMK